MELLLLLIKWNKGLKVNLACVYKSQWSAQKKEKKQQKNSTNVPGKSVELKKHGPGWGVDNRNQTFLLSAKKKI